MAEMFQSLSGVLDVCNRIIARMRCAFVFVSIPFRGFRCLQLVPGVTTIVGLLVSIPFRGFRCLQPNESASSHKSASKFQSLSGVLDVCNANLHNVTFEQSDLFQSLSGVLDVCNHYKTPPLLLRCGVSIPFRGFRCLQLEKCYSSQERKKCFNPFQGF